MFCLYILYKHIYIYKYLNILCNNFTYILNTIFYVYLYKYALLIYDLYYKHIYIYKHKILYM